MERISGYLPQPDFQAGIRRKLSELEVFIDFNLALYPFGFQLDVCAPGRWVDLNDFRRIRGEEPNDFDQVFFSLWGGRYYVEPVLGFLNILKDSATGEKVIEYKPNGEGQSWRVIFGRKSIKIEGECLEKAILEAFSSLFPEGKPNLDSEKVHLSKGTIFMPKSLRRYSRGGEPLHSSWEFLGK